MKVLIATDGSPPSLAAPNGLIARRNWFAQPLQLAMINVHPTLPYASWAGKENVARYYDEEGDAAFAPASALLDQHELKHEKVKRVGEPAHEIVKYADGWGADLVIMGTHGHSGITNMLLGSVAQKVLATSTIPVLLLR